MKKNILFLLIISMIFTAPLWGARDIETTKIKLAEINSKLNIKKNKLNYIRKEERKVLNKLKKIKKDMRYTKNNLRYAKYRLQKNESLLNQLGQDLVLEQKKLDTEIQMFQKRVREIYKSNNLGYLEFLFSSVSLSDFINQSYFFEKIIIKDVEIIKKLRLQKRKIRQTKTYIKNKVSEVRHLTKKIEQEKNQIQSQMNQEQKVYSSIYKKRLAYQKEIAGLQRNSQEIETLLQRLLASKKGVKLKGSGKYVWPLERKKFWVSSSYGYRRHPIFRVVRFHSGLDLAANRGTPVKAADNGEVVFSGLWGGYGKAIIIDHGNGYSTVYAHLSHIYVKKGQVVTKKNRIGLVGSSGYATGPHLHFEIRRKGKTMNPIGKLPKRW
ncbi:murein hydrolase activator EnvC family protein [Candidatus Margulisiibacteriota bacterium]